MALRDEEFCPRCGSDLLYLDERDGRYRCLNCEWHRDFIDALQGAKVLSAGCLRRLVRLFMIATHRG